MVELTDKERIAALEDDVKTLTRHIENEENRQFQINKQFIELIANIVKTLETIKR